jgi:DNA-binding transcriptional regulator YiaG
LLHASFQVSSLINFAHSDNKYHQKLMRQAIFIKMSEINQITGRQIAAARALLGMGQVELAALAKISAPTLRRMEASPARAEGMKNNVAAVITALESAGIKFIEDGQTSAGGGPGVRLLRSDNQFDTDVTQTVQYPEHLQPDAPTGAGG